MDIASLGLQIDTSDVSKAEADLDRLNASAAKTEASAQKTGKAWKEASASIGGAQIKDASAQIDKTTASLNKAGVSAKQTAAALRGVPAQFTDIAVGLQGGQNPLSVLLQQGGQLKDMFGGIGPAARALGGYVAGLVNPFTLAAAAVGALAFAYKQGSDEATAFTKAIVLSGNAAGTTSDNLAGIAASIDDTVGTTKQAAAALAEMVSSGKIAEDQLQNLATAAIAFEDATGQAVSKTIEEFNKLGGDPVKASIKLNEQYGYLTAAVFEQIQALEEQGRTDEAAALAQETYARALNDRADEIKQSLGTLESAWDAVGNAAAEAWDAALAVGREATIDERIADLKAQLQEVADVGSAGPRGRAAFQLGAGKGGAGDLAQQLNTLELEREQQQGEARQKAALAANNKAAIEAEQDIAALRISNLTKAEKKEREIADYRANVEKIRIANPFSKLIDPANVDKDLAAIEEKYRDKSKPKQPKAYQDDAATKLLANLKEQGAALDGQIATTDKITSAQRDLLKFQQQIADLKTKDVLTADQKSLLANQDAITAQLQKNVALASEVEKRQELLKLQERSDQIGFSIDAAAKSTAAQRELELSTVGLGKKLQEQAKAQAEIRKEFDRYQRQLDKSTPADALGSKEYNEATRRIEQGLDEALKAHKDYYADLDKLQKDSAKGAEDAINDYIESSKDAASSMNELTSNALGGIEDAFTEFAVTGKLTFKSLVDSILADFARMGVRTLMGKALAGLSTGTTEGGASTFDFGSLFGSIAGAFSFDGGGYTGDAARLGGVDGKGGFMAVLHPQETIVDHTKPSRSQAGGSVTIGSMNFPGITNAREARVAVAEASRQIARAVGSAGRYA